MTYSSGGSVNSKLWLNGNELTQTTTSSSTYSFQASEYLIIGTWINNATVDTSYTWDGKISNFKLYNVALEPSEVQKLYRLGRTGRSMVISDTAVGIGKVPEAQLDVRGNIKCDVIMPKAIAFSAYSTGYASQTITGIFPGDSTRYNFGNCYDPSTYKFKAPLHGLYDMKWGSFTNTTPTNNSRINAYLNGVSYMVNGATVEKHGNAMSVTVEMNAGDFFWFSATSSSSPVYYYGGSSFNFFSGHLICAL